MKIDNALTRIVTVGMITALVTNSLLAVAHATTPLSGEYDCQTGLLSSDDRSTYTVTNGDVSFGNDCAGILVIPAGVTSIGDSAFNSASGLTSITIPTSVTSIGNYAFFGTTGLTSITIPADVTSIGNGTFEGATGLTSITIPAGVTSIGNSAFAGATGLTSITIPAGVTSIGSGAFFGATGLASIYFRGKAPASVGGGAFYGVANGAKAHISAIASGFGTDTSWNGLVVERVVLKIRAAAKVKPNII